MNTNALDFLIASQHESGGWGFHTDYKPALEPTAAVLLSLSGVEKARQSFDRGLGWLLEAQNPDGGWGYTLGDTESTWLTAWAVLTLGKVGKKDEPFHNGKAWLLGERTFQQEASEQVEAVFGPEAARGPASQSWPWLPGEATWVEPTAFSLLALAQAELSGDERVRIEAGLAYLQERRCPGGGWSVGDPIMFSQSLPARVQQTACVALAFSAYSPELIHPEDLQRLGEGMQQEGGAMALSWGLLAFRSLGKLDLALMEKLDHLQLQDGSWGSNPYLTAITVMAKRGYL